MLKQVAPYAFLGYNKHIASISTWNRYKINKIPKQPLVDKHGKPVTPLRDLPFGTDPNTVKDSDLKNYTSNLEQLEKFWGDQYHDEEEQFKGRQEKNSVNQEERFPPRKIFRDQEIYRARVLPQAVMKCIYDLYKNPEKPWKLRDLSSHFGLPIVQVKRIIKNGEVEEQIIADFKRYTKNKNSVKPLTAEEKEFQENRFPPPEDPLKKKEIKLTQEELKEKAEETERVMEKINNDQLEDKSEDEDEDNEKDNGEEKEKLSDHLNSKLQELVEKTYIGDEEYEPWKTYTAEVFNTRTGRFGYSKKLELFGSTDEETLKFDLGSKVPTLRRREIPKSGPGSGNAIKSSKKLKPLDCPLIITDITRKKTFRPFSRNIPIKIRNADGSLRFPTFLEYNRIRTREVPDLRKKKFSPH